MFLSLKAVIGRPEYSEWSYAAPPFSPASEALRAGNSAYSGTRNTVLNRTLVRREIGKG